MSASHSLPPVRTCGTAGAVGSTVASVFGRRGTPRAPAVTPPAPRQQPAPRTVTYEAVEDDDESEGSYPRSEPVTRPGSNQTALGAPRQITLGELWGSQQTDDDLDEGWDPRTAPRPASRAARTPSTVSGSALAAGALGRLFPRSSS